MCRNLSKIQVAQASDSKKEGAPETQQQVSTVNFRKLLITRCQTEFEKIREAEDDVEKKHALIIAEADPVNIFYYYYFEEMMVMALGEKF
jgi:hypothetical protein